MSSNIRLQSNSIDEHNAENMRSLFLVSDHFEHGDNAVNFVGQSTSSGKFHQV